MIDHLIRFDNDAEYDAARASYNLNDGNSSKTYVHTVNADGSYNYLPYVYVWASFETLNQDLRNDPRCMLVSDSEAFSRNESFILYCPIPKADLNNYFVEPVRMSSNYPFGDV